MIGYTSDCFLHIFSAIQPFALTSAGRAWTLLGSRKISKPIPLQIRLVYFESLPRFKCRIWGHRTRSVASGSVSEGRVGPVHYPGDRAGRFAGRG